MEVIVKNGSLSPEEQKYYENYVLDKYPRLKIRRLYITVDGDYATFSIEPQKRFLTKMGGSMIGDPYTWNDSKRAEYFDTIPNTL